MSGVDPLPGFWFIHVEHGHGHHLLSGLLLYVLYK